MQNNPEKKNGAFKQFLKEKGYYIVLGLCVLAVGVSGFLFVKTAANRSSVAQAGDPTLSVPLTPSGTETRQPSGGGNPRKTGGSDAAKTPGAREDAAETVAPDTDTTPAAPAPAEPVRTVRPLSGETQAGYSMDALAYNETTQDWRTHDGIDIAASVGDAVTAARDGTVSAVYDDSSLGKVVVVNHDGGCATHYANLADDVAVSVGQTVRAGDVLGAIGESATVELAQAGHLHFAVYRGQEPMDPEAFLSQ